MHRQAGQGAGDPDLLAGGARGDLAFPGQPRRARGQVPRRPAAAGVELGDQLQEPAGPGGQVRGQLADPLLQPLQRHQRRVEVRCA